MYKKEKTAKAWCLTVNNPIYLDYQVVDKLMNVSTLASHSLIHMVVGYEHYNIVDLKYRKLTPHLQIAMCFAEPKSFREIKSLFPRAHIECLRTSYVRAVKYCKKEEGALLKEVGSFSYAIFNLYNVLMENYQDDKMFLHCVMMYGSQEETKTFFTESMLGYQQDAVGDKGVSITPPIPPASSPDTWELDRLNKI